MHKLYTYVPIALRTHYRATMHINRVVFSCPESAEPTLVCQVAVTYDLTGAKSTCEFTLRFSTKEFRRACGLLM